MASGIFYRNVRARDQLELFLLSAATSLLLTRFYLHIAGYPQIGGGGLHIAHMLWGGLFMLAALAIALSFLGARALRLAAIIGGAGFGIFIDELGKFITEDNDYFYQPAIGIIYGIFIILYLVFNFLGKSRTLTTREYHLNALSQLEEAIVHDMDPAEKERVHDLLQKADPDDPITKQLQKLFQNMRTVPTPKPNRLTRIVRQIDSWYEQFRKRRDSNRWIRAFFLVEAGIFLIGIIVSIYHSVDSIFDLIMGAVPYSLTLAVGQLISSLVAAGFVLRGTLLMSRSRLRGYEQFRRATLVNIFLTEFFMFSRMEFGALPGFLFNLSLLGLIAFAMHQEVRLHAQAALKK